jgi:hypothetical protein
MARGIKIRFGWRGLARASRAVALLAGALALIVQFALAAPHLAVASDSAVAELAALTGEHLVLCADAQGGSHSPAQHEADCSGLCCHLGQQLATALPPAIAVSGAVTRRSAELPPVPSSAAPDEKHFSNAQPRGPPASA